MIHAASHFDHKKRVAWVLFSMHTCGSVSIIMELRLAVLRAAGASLKKLQHVQNAAARLGRLPFTKKFRKFRLGCKWNTTHWKISGKSGTSEKVVPFSRWKLPNGNLCSIYRISRLYHQFHAFRSLFKRPGFPGLPRVSKKWRLILVKFLEAFCKQTSGLLRVLCLSRSSATSRKFIAVRCLI